MKFNWGTGIAIFYIVFMAAMIGMVVKSTSYDHSLVVKNYYEEDLKYQKHYDKLVNSQEKGTVFNYKYQAKEKMLKIEFPGEISGVEGQVYFYRPSDSKLDFEVPLQLNPDNHMEVSTKDLAKGRWLMKCNWKVGEKDFYKKVDLFL